MSAFEPTDDQRRLVELCVMGGISQEEIAKAVGVSAPTLRKHFRAELDAGHVKATAQVVNTAFRMATSGDVPAMTIFWLKARAGWSEKGPAVAEPAKETEPDKRTKPADREDVLQKVRERIEAIAPDKVELGF